MAKNDPVRYEHVFVCLFDMQNMLACITKHQDHKRMSPLGKEPFQTLRFLMSHTHGRVVILARMASLSRQQLKRRFVTCVIKIKRRL